MAERCLCPTGICMAPIPYKKCEVTVAHGRAEELTGRRRYRLEVPNFASRLLLQVEVSVFACVEEGKPGRWVCEWRDATPADIAEGELA